MLEIGLADRGRMIPEELLHGRRLLTNLRQVWRFQPKLYFQGWTDGFPVW
jgi:hypothetical protein